MAMASDSEIAQEKVHSSGQTNTSHINGSADNPGQLYRTKDVESADQQSQSLAEDDSVAQSINSGKSSALFRSSSEAAVPYASTSVTSERKQVLLAQARADRLDWIRKVPLPYKCESSKTHDNSSVRSLDSDTWDRDPRLAELKNSIMVQKSKSALQVLSHLYGIDQTLHSSEQNSGEPLHFISKRVGAILDQIVEDGGDDDRKIAAATAEQIRTIALAEDRDDAVLRAYHSWVSKLADPAAAVLVQGMRNFCRKICNNPADTLANNLQIYLRSTSETLNDYAPWKNDEVDQETRRSLESFIYGQCEEYLENLYWTEERKEEERQWQSRLDALQFVGPKHLEISCLEEEETDSIKEIFEKPVDALLSVERYFSPFEKLQRILAIYQNVNAALTNALNRKNDSGVKKLPSADDVLPSIILTVLLARPSRLLLNLQLIEDFSPPEYLRGEAGYAYTNVYGAVQFLKDINLDAEKPESLRIEAEDFRKSLKACIEVAEAQRRKSSFGPSSDSEEPKFTPPEAEISIPISKIRDARKRGEVVDLKWAKEMLLESCGMDPQVQETSGTENAANDEADDLPKGFSRSYTFLSSRPEDIKLSDLHKLLAEYKMLVHTTETLVGEKISRSTAEKKKKLALKQKEVYEAAQRVDPSLLPSQPNSKRK